MLGSPGANAVFPHHYARTGYSASLPEFSYRDSGLPIASPPKLTPTRFGCASHSPLYVSHWLRIILFRTRSSTVRPVGTRPLLPAGAMVREPHSLEWIFDGLCSGTPVRHRRNLDSPEHGFRATSSLDGLSDPHGHYSRRGDLAKPARRAQPARSVLLRHRHRGRYWGRIKCSPPHGGSVRRISPGA